MLWWRFSTGSFISSATDYSDDPDYLALTSVRPDQFCVPTYTGTHPSQVHTGWELNFNEVAENAFYEQQVEFLDSLMIDVNGMAVAPNRQTVDAAASFVQSFLVNENRPPIDYRDENKVWYSLDSIGAQELHTAVFTHQQAVYSASRQVIEQHAVTPYPNMSAMVADIETKYLSIVE